MESKKRDCTKCDCKKTSKDPKEQLPSFKREISKKELKKFQESEAQTGAIYYGEFQCVTGEEEKHVEAFYLMMQKSEERGLQVPCKAQDVITFAVHDFFHKTTSLFSRQISTDKVKPDQETLSVDISDCSEVQLAMDQALEEPLPKNTMALFVVKAKEKDGFFKIPLARQ